MAGLLADPTNHIYTTSKHAVVGFSLSLRPQAAALGIKVSVVCPDAVESGVWGALEIVTPMTIPWDEAAKRVMPFKLMDTGRAVRIILAGVAHNEAVIVFPAHGRVLWWLNRINFALLEPSERAW